jgi:hypothetical protein
MLQQQQNMGESKAYNITAAPQQTPYNPRSQEQAKYNKRTVAHDNRVSIGTKSMSQHHQINPQSIFLVPVLLQVTVSSMSFSKWLCISVCAKICPDILISTFLKSRK